MGTRQFNFLCRFLGSNFFPSSLFQARVTPERSALLLSYWYHSTLRGDAYYDDINNSFFCFCAIYALFPGAVTYVVGMSYVCCMSVVCQINCVGGITWPKRILKVLLGRLN